MHQSKHPLYLLCIKLERPHHLRTLLHTLYNTHIHVHVHIYIRILERLTYNIQKLFYFKCMFVAYFACFLQLCNVPPYLMLLQCAIHLWPRPQVSPYTIIRPLTHFSMSQRSNDRARGELGDEANTPVHVYGHSNLYLSKHDVAGQTKALRDGWNRGWRGERREI